MRLEKADAFREDFALQALWYVRQAGDEVARRFQQAVDSTLGLLCEQPGIGRERRFRHPKLQGLRSLVIGRPFQRLVVFYRADGDDWMVHRHLPSPDFHRLDWQPYGLRAKSAKNAKRAEEREEREE